MSSPARKPLGSLSSNSSPAHASNYVPKKTGFASVIEQWGAIFAPTINSSRRISSPRRKKSSRNITDSSKKRKQARRERSSIVADDFGMTMVIQSPDTPDPDTPNSKGETPIEKKLVRKMNGKGKKTNRPKPTSGSKKNKSHASKTPTIPLTKPSRTKTRMNYDRASDLVRTNLSVDVDQSSSLMNSTDSSVESIGKVVPSAPSRGENAQEGKGQSEEEPSDDTCVKRNPVSNSLRSSLCSCPLSRRSFKQGPPPNLGRGLKGS